MTRRPFAVFTALAFTTVIAIADVRDLTSAERAALESAASESAGLPVWLIQGNARQIESGDTALASVTFEPVKLSGYCLAPLVLFEAESKDDELVDWAPVSGFAVQYWFWYQDCDIADPQSPIVLKHLIDTTVLERLRTRRDQIVRDGVEGLGRGRDYEIPVSEHRLRSVDIQFDRLHGTVYKLDYWGDQCRGLSLKAVLRSDSIDIVEAFEWMC